MGWIKDFVINNAGKILKIAIPIGGAAAAAGVAANIYADNVNEQAKSIAENAQTKYQKHFIKAQDTLNQIGKVKYDVSTEFDEFADVIERIQGRPEFKKKIIGRESLPEINLEELKELSNGFQMIVGGAGGAGVGALAGIALFGLNPVVIGPAAIFGGLALCIQGFTFGSKAKKHLEEAKDLQKKVDQMCIFLDQINSEGLKFINLINSVLDLYHREFVTLKNATLSKTNWKKFSRDEKKACKNAILYVQLLVNLCKLEFLVINKENDGISKINKAEISAIEKQIQTQINKAS